VEYRFKADEWFALSKTERARRCRLLALEAMSLSSTASEALSVQYMAVATALLKLATELEKPT
jgi:hypothetical protein